MNSFLVSTGVVAIAEIGDKTQLLALLLAARFRKPGPIILAILVATLANHALAALAGLMLAGWLKGDLFQWVLGVSFVLMGLWTLKPDTLAEAERQRATGASAFLVTLVAFFLVEIGDKTQVATMALAAKYQSVLWVTAGTTLGMMLANVPVVLMGDRAANRLPLTAIRMAAAGVFILLGGMIMLKAAGIAGG
ncbi:TMEM165/GDT1 family protein [Emcibacter sp. SYSU 3D8]|uniref:TMEM165/GDT1 family protein n=1 Tax=Emcibacter sp. SYSU 3D8 TaxID=3133969 RepID=UPI0031FF0EF7